MSKHQLLTAGACWFSSDLTCSHARFGIGHAAFVLAAFRLAVMMLAHTHEQVTECPICM